MFIKSLKCKQCGRGQASAVAMSQVEVSFFEKAHSHGLVTAVGLFSDGSLTTEDTLSGLRDRGHRAVTVAEQHAMPGALGPSTK
jgi:hypothetical protein